MNIYILGYSGFIFYSINADFSDDLCFPVFKQLKVPALNVASSKSSFSNFKKHSFFQIPVKSSISSLNLNF